MAVEECFFTWPGALQSFIRNCMTNASWRNKTLNEIVLVSYK